MQKKPIQSTVRLGTEHAEVLVRQARPGENTSDVLRRILLEYDAAVRAAGDGRFIP